MATGAASPRFGRRKWLRVNYLDEGHLKVGVPISASGLHAQSDPTLMRYVPGGV
jgi:hypothetical protein